jgi:hypothetical protein
LRARSPAAEPPASLPLLPAPPEAAAAATDATSKPPRKAARRSADLSWARAESSQQMGVLIDVLTLILGTGFSASQLVMTIANWRRARHPAPVVMISQEVGDGRTIRIETSDPAILAQAVRELESS